MTADYIVESDMGFTREEFIARLPAAVFPLRVNIASPNKYVAGGNQNKDTNKNINKNPTTNINKNTGPNTNTNGARNNAYVEIHIASQTTRTIGALQLPVMRVKLVFYGFNQIAFDKFMRRYKNYLHKGGG